MFITITSKAVEHKRIEWRIPFSSTLICPSGVLRRGPHKERLSKIKVKKMIDDSNWLKAQTKKRRVRKGNVDSCAVLPLRRRSKGLLICCVPCACAFGQFSSKRERESH